MKRSVMLAALGAGLLSTAVARAAEPTLGAELYAAHCAGCHGPTGEGDGPLASTIPVPNIRSLQMRNGGVFPADSVTDYIDGRRMPAAHGDRLMPVWGEVFAAQTRADKKIVRGRIAALVGFMAELQYPR
jgi:mono/diheme cytochrome c family protein